jgi:beta-lactamase class A
MKKLFVTIICFVIICSLSIPTKAQKNKEFSIPKDYKPAKVEKFPAYQTIVDKAVSQTIAKFSAKGLKEKDIAVTMLDLGDANNLRAANFRGEEKIYPASVSKMFYMVALERWLEDGKVKLTPELQRGLSDMIVISSNEATQYVLDVLTGTSSGAELPEKEFQKWAYKRNIVNRYYAAMGYRNINVNQKTFCEDAYGIEQQFRGYQGNNRNMLTTNATARLLAEIVLGKTNTPARTQEMMNLMKRDWEAQSGASGEPEFISTALKSGTKLWTKEGWTSKTRHDAAYLETPDGKKLVIVIFTENFSQEKEIIPTIAKNILDGLEKFQ